MSYFLKGMFVIFLLFQQLEAKDFGVYGATSFIEEEDLIYFLQERTKHLSEDERDHFMERIQTSATSKLKETMEVKGIGKVKVYSFSYFDPSICVDQDIFNHKGEIIVKKWTHFNPLSHFQLHQDLLFFDATDSVQVTWAESLSYSQWVLVKGKPMELEEKSCRPVYFDQEGMLIKKFKIHQVPARVSQEGLRLKIEYIPLGAKVCVN